MRREKTSPENPESKYPARQADDISAAPGRRSFLGRLGLGATLAALAGQTFAWVRSLIPNVRYEAPQRYKVGLPSQFGEGAKYLDDKRVFIFRERNTFYAISASCTHLGCTVKMQRLSQPKKVTVGARVFEEQQEFHCPCHGSRYYGDGTNYAGPAPKPLSYLKLELAPEDGQLVVDSAIPVEQEFRLTV
jgi:cytochrome b6-f complex iron-sulfur subunit